ncbi:MAG: GNAT family N-acetyltransferase [Lonepinella koalarum]|nr:GNAT family N-acetyltransferase [Lonepinella koalarum]
MLERQLEVIFTDKPPYFLPDEPESAVFLCEENISKAKNLLGQEFTQIGYDCRQGINLDALAIAVGTLKAGGKLTLWLDKNQQVDLDSLRWCGETQAIATPNFYRHFYRLLEEYFSPKTLSLGNHVAQGTIKIGQAGLVATPAQDDIIQQILQSKAEIFILTAKRGRGKSALAGLLAQQLRSENPRQKIWLTAPNKSAVKTLQVFAETPIEFIAPDALCHQIEQYPTKFNEDWLLIDEAAMLPLPLLFQLMSPFKHILCTTTIHSYEGTGRGFLLKFLPNLHRTFKQFELTTPLRWSENDKLERFIDELLLLEADKRLIQPDIVTKSAVNIFPVSQQALTNKIEGFYGLLTLAHYRTSPLDLRRLLDAPKQQFWVAEAGGVFIGVVWLVEEGGLQDEGLIAQICEGCRRPKGNLAAQKLAHEHLDADFLRQKSLRISRIAILPKWQRQGLGQKMINQIIAQSQVDFFSASFGYTPELASFWQKCGFKLVQIGDNREASSGCYSAIVLRESPGNPLIAKSAVDFQRDLVLRNHDLKIWIEEEDVKNPWQFREKDQQKVQNFVENNRTFYSSRPAILRLLRQTKQNEKAFFEMFSTIKEKKAQLQAMRLKIKLLLQNN